MLFRSTHSKKLNKDFQITRQKMTSMSDYKY